MKTALIVGVSGQDGAYLSRFLLEKHYVVHGTSRDAKAHDFARLHALGVNSAVIKHTVSTTDADALRSVLRSVRPDEIYNFAGLSSVALSFAEPEAAWKSVAEAQMLLLDTVRTVAPRARLYHSASSECFGDLPAQSAACETTPFAPRSPYGEAKVAAYRATVESRTAHGLYACCGLVFNHESPLRGETFVTKKIFASAAAARGSVNGRLHLGDLTASRDWGYAPEYVEAMWLMLQQPEPEDYVIATGESHTVEELAAAAFGEFGLDWREHVVVDESLLRRAELRYSRGDASRARDRLGWEARTRFRDLVRLLANAVRRSEQAQ